MQSEKLVRIIGAGLTATTLAFGAAAPALAEQAPKLALKSYNAFEATLVDGSLSVRYPLFDFENSTMGQRLSFTIKTDEKSENLSVSATYEGPDKADHTLTAKYNKAAGEWYGGYISKDGEVSFDILGHEFTTSGNYTLVAIEVISSDDSVTFTTGLEAGNYRVINGYDTNVYRTYNPNSGEHFYTVSSGEVDALIAAGWKYEGVAFVSVRSGSLYATPVYRVYNPNSGDHHYTMSAGERDLLVAAGWSDEGVAFYSYDTQKRSDNEDVYRLYNPNAKTGSHHYTMSAGEVALLVAAGWNNEGTGWYAWNGEYL